MAGMMKIPQFARLFGGGNLMEKALDRPEVNIPYEQTPYERNQGVDSSSFDVTDTKQVKAVQKMLGLKGDGVFGPKTQAAWRDYVGRGRRDAGLEAYFYEDAVPGQVSTDYINSGAPEEPSYTPIQSSSVLQARPPLGPGGYGAIAKKRGY